MKKVTLFIVLFATAGGLLGGYFAKKSVSVPVAEKIQIRPPSVEKSIPAKEISYPRSQDTPETLLPPDAPFRYARTAAWLADATELEIARFWTAYLGSAPSTEITQLIFTQWTRLDATAALAAAGEKFQQDAWRSWASHSPQDALAAAIAAGENVETVAEAIGQFHPAWLRAHMDQIPEFAKQAAIQGLRNASDTTDPLATLKFMRDHKMPFQPETFKALIHQDPWAALDWLIENPSIKNQASSNENPFKQLFDSMSRERPADLQRLANQTQPGQLKRQMETALFTQLVATDPTAALAQARATEVPLIAAERLAKIGMPLIKSDPAQALQLAKEILERNTESLTTRTEISYENGSMTWDRDEALAEDFMEKLIQKEPGKLLDIAAQAGKTSTGTSQVFSSLTYEWADQDLLGYTEWVNQQQDPAIRDEAVFRVVSRLADKAQFLEAAEWMMTISKPERVAHILFYDWKIADRAGAAAWIESAAIPNATKEIFRNQIE